MYNMLPRVRLWTMAYPPFHPSNLHLLRHTQQHGDQNGLNGHRFYWTAWEGSGLRKLLGREAVYGNSSRWFKFSQELTSDWYKLLCGWWTSARTCLRWVEAHIERCSLVSHGSLDEDKPNNQEVVPRPGGHPIRFRCTHSKCTKWIMIFAAHAKHSETLCVCIRLYKYIYNAMWYTHT